MNRIILEGTVTKVTDNSVTIDTPDDGQFTIKLKDDLLRLTFVEGARITLDITSSYLPMPNPTIEGASR